MYKGKYLKEQPLSNAAVPETPKSDSPAVDRVRKRKKRVRPGTILFYSIYCLLTVTAIAAILIAMPKLNSWLTDFEASQPNHKRDEVFAQLFENPDWKQLYALAGIQDTKFENADTFAAYMQQKVGDQKLTWLETSAGLSGDKKFFVKLENEKLACFTLTSGEKTETNIPEWRLGSLELFFIRTQSVLVERFPGQTVYINGVALTDEYTIRKVSTLAENYLPQGISGYHSEVQQVTELLSQPDVQVVNADGSIAQIIYDEQKQEYFQADPTFVPTEEEKQLALNAVKTYAKYMIKSASLGDVQKYFSTGSKIYATIVASEVGWMQSFASFDFTEPEYVDFYRYSDDVFSIGVNMVLNVKRNNGTIKEYDLNNQLVFQKNGSGKYMVYEMTNINIQQREKEVRLTFLRDDEVITSHYVDANANSIMLPSVSGLTAWVTKEADSTGKVTLTVVYGAVPEVFLPDDTELEPMTLYAYFEKVED